MKTIKAIETQYKGYRFRSRLEARWAVFFDALGWEWEYEREGFELPSGRYLPDFYLPHTDCWAEVKPFDFSEKEQQLAFELSILSGCTVFELVGVPKAKAYLGWTPCCVDAGDSKSLVTAEGWWYMLTNFRGIYQGDRRHYIAFEGREDADIADDTVKAAESAKSARFEFGERGRPVKMAAHRSISIAIPSQPASRTTPFGEPVDDFQERMFRGKLLEITCYLGIEDSDEGWSQISREQLKKSIANIKGIGAMTYLQLNAYLSKRGISLAQ